MVIKAADMMIARRADTQARADFATWKMMAKLNGASALPDEAHAFLTRYRALLKDMPEPQATEAIIQLVYRRYYNEMGGTGVPPDVKAAQSSDPVTGTVTAFRRPEATRPKPAGGADTQPRLPVALIFACLVVVYVGIRYFTQ